jgi:hypothetical protein
MSMHKFSWIVGAALVLGGCGGGAQPEAKSPAAGSEAAPEQAATTPAPAGWKVVDEKGGNFSVLMPDNAQRTSNGEDKDKLVIWTGRGADGAVYIAGSFLVPAGESSLEGATKSFAKGVMEEGCKGKVETVKQGTVMGHDAYKFLGKCDDGAPAVGFLRKQGERFYTSVAFVRPEGSGEDFERFINSMNVHGE